MRGDGLGRLGKAAVLVLAVVVGAAVGLLGSFQQAQWVHLLGIRTPVGVIAALLLSVAVFVTAGLLSRSRAGAGLALAGWLITAGTMSTRRPEGDLVVPATVSGLVWLFGGALLGGLCVAWPYGLVRQPRREGW